MNENNNEKDINKKITNEVAGDKFDDLTKEEMEKVQGQGQNGTSPKNRSLWDFINSKGEYVCR